MMSSLWMKDVAGVEGLCISSKLFATLMSSKFVVCIDSDCVENVIRLVGLGVYGGGPVMLTIPHRGGEVCIDEGKWLLELDRQGADGGFGQIRQDRAGGCVDAGVPSVERRRRRCRGGGRGAYFLDGKVEKVKAFASDADAARELWDVLEKLSGVKFEL